MATYDYQVTIESSLTSEHQRFMSEAIAEARKSADAGGVPLGCVLVKEGRIIGRGHNRRIQDSDPIMHAEIAALRDALRQGDLDACRGATLYCTGMSCDMCAAANVYWGVKEVVLARLDGYKNNRPLYEANGVRVIEVDLDEPKRLLKQFNETHP
ncbi:MAG: nucleoside deaminase [Planctomycetaceae bacterium]|nr:nucleoside deaminase [Planctomycetaceae bacterium]